MRAMTRLAVAAAMAIGLAAPAAAQQEGAQLSIAKDLYASARYDEALSVLNRLRTAERVDRKSVEQYRSLCLLALGRASEAETAIAAVITADPLFQPAESDASPRVRSTFADVRRRLLPELARTRYLSAKTAYDRGDFVDAQQQFRVALALIDDPDTGGRLGDLRVLAAGFLELSAKAAAPPPPPAPAATAPPAAPATTPAPSRAEAVGTRAEASPIPEPARIYEADQEGIVAPGVIKQDIPKVPSNVIAMAKSRGLLEVVIDQRGRVVSMAMRMSVHPLYDGQLLAAARDWKYEPATLDGQPVQYRKLIQIAVQR